MRKFESAVFLKNLALMFDALEELSDLSLALQKANISLAIAHRLISRQIEVFEARKETQNDDKYAEACKAVQEKCFGGVNISQTGKEKEIHKRQFYQSLCDSMRARMMPNTGKELCSAVSVLDKNNWPAEIDPLYGEQSLRYLCDKFSVSFSEVKICFRDYKDGHDNINGALKKLSNRVNTLPISTAACKRGFSKMNIVCSSLRSQLSIEHMSALLFISICGRPQHLWQPLPYVKSWMAKNRHHALSNTCPAREAFSQKSSYDKTTESL